MSTKPDPQHDALIAFTLLASTAAQMVATGDPDGLVVPMNKAPSLPG